MIEKPTIIVLINRNDVLARVENVKKARKIILPLFKFSLYSLCIAFMSKYCRVRNLYKRQFHFCLKTLLCKRKSGYDQR